MPPQNSNQSPIADLQQILSENGEDVAKLFGPALTIFAGPYSNTKSADEKRRELEKLILGYEK